MTIQEDAVVKALNHEIPYEEMNVFSSTIGLDLDDNEDTVDNRTDNKSAEAIMDDDEEITAG